MSIDPRSPRSHARKRPYSVACALAVAALGGMMPRRAAADDTIQLAFTAHGTWLPRLPAVRITPTETWLRSVPDRQVAVPGQGVYLGLGMDAAFVPRDRWLIPLGGLEISLPVTTSSPSYAAAGGSIVELKPSTAKLFTVLGPGIGARFKQRRWMFSGSLRTGIGIMAIDALVAAGGEAAPATAFGVLPMARGELSICRRLDPTSRACLFVAAHIHQFDWANGLAGGLRWELGP